MIEFILSAPFVLSAICVIAVAMSILLEYELEGWATTLFSIGTALVLWAYKSEIWDLMSTNPMPLLYFSINYVVIGLAWSLFKWKLYIGIRTEKFNMAKQQFTNDKGEIKSQWELWTRYLNEGRYGYFNHNFSFVETPEQIIKKIIPLANSKKTLIVSWISYWPMSLGATMLNNPFRKFFEFIYSLVSGIYDKMGNSAAEKLMVGFEKDEPLKKKEIIKG